MAENLPVTSGLVLDLDADQITGVADGANITTWTDTSGVGNDVTQATSGDRPNWDASLFQLGNRAAVLFNGTNDNFGAAVLDLSAVTGLTVFCVQYMSNHGLSGRANACAVGRDTSADRGYAVGSDNDGTLSGRAFLVIASSAAARTRRDGNLIDTRDLPCLITARFDASVEMSLRINGADDTGAIDAAIPATIANDGGPTFQVGSNGFLDDWGGYIARVLIYDRALTDTERNDMERWLMSRHQLIGMSESFEGPTTECHQGYAFDAANSIHFTFDTDAIHRRLNDAGWTIIEENLAPFAGLATVNHLADGDYYAGKLYVPMEFWGGSCGSFSTQKLCVFDAVTLERDSATDISAQAHECSGCCVVRAHGTNGVVYITSFCDDTQIFKYDLSTFAYLGALTLSGDTIDKLQGITFREGWFYLSGSEGYIWRMNQAGLCKLVYHDARETGTVAYEGIDFHGSTLRWLIDEDTSSTTADKFVHYFTLVDDGIGDDVQSLQHFDPIFEPLEETTNPLTFEMDDTLVLEAITLDRWHQPYETPEDPWPEFEAANVQAVVIGAGLLQPPSTDFFICMCEAWPVEEDDGGVESFGHFHVGGLVLPPVSPLLFYKHTGSHAMYEFSPASTAKSVYFYLRDSTSGEAKTSLTSASPGIAAAYVREQGTAVPIALSDLAAANSAWASGGLKEVSNGLYRLDVPNAAFATGVNYAEVTLTASSTLGDKVTVILRTSASNVGAGAVPYTVTVTDDSAVPLEGAACWVTSNAAGTFVVAGTLTSNSLGQVTFYLDSGAALYLWVQHNNYSVSNPQPFTVS